MKFSKKYYRKRNLTSYYTDLYILLKARYTRKGTLCAGIKLRKMVAVSTLLLSVQSHSRFATCLRDIFMLNIPQRF